MGSKARRTYDALLAATEELLATGGYSQATSTAIAEEAGFAVGTFYSYFEDRNSALAALLADRLDALISEVGESLTIETLLDDGPRRVIERTIDSVLATYRHHSPVFRAALLELPASPAIRDVYWDRHARSQQLIATWVARGQRAQIVRDDVDAEAIAQALLVLFQSTNSPLVLGAKGRQGTEVRKLLVDSICAVLQTPAT